MGGMRIPKNPYFFALVLESLSHLPEISRPIFNFDVMYSFRRKITSRGIIQEITPMPCHLLLGNCTRAARATTPKWDDESPADEV